MVIHNLFTEEREDHKRMPIEGFTETFDIGDQKKGLPIESAPKARHWVSTLVTRLFFLLLLLADLLWATYTLAMLSLVAIVSLMTGFKWTLSRQGLDRYWLTFKRCLVCGLSLFVGLFSPTFGIMIACTYFITYDKEGMDEIIPASFKQTFQPFFKP